MADDLHEEAWWESNDDKQKISKKAQKRKHAPENGNTEESSIDNTTLWKYFLRETKGRLSEIELEELATDESQYLAFEKLPVTLDQLSASLKKAIPNWEKNLSSVKESDKGCPLLLIITGSAIRCVDLLREIKPFRTSQCKTAKLFAKHFKLEEQQHYLTKAVVHICAGTPNRILKLASNGYLKFKKLKYVLIDWSFKDAKQRQMVDIKEVKSDFNQLLQLEILPRINKRKVQFTLF
ncbi:protein CMSS1-like isoform X3 [Rhopilema esculentum]|uniref:protein CMSS1-like isoform X3 n=1 Tax=Rhopilema esculentum TaxID=499914 RepID=UPI0031E10304